MFLDVVDLLQIYPRYLRADMGSETALIMNSFWQLHQVRIPDIPHSEVAIYGKSTQNIRIESWWRHLIVGQTNKYMVRIAIYFPYI